MMVSLVPMRVVGELRVGVEGLAAFGGLGRTEDTELALVAREVKVRKI